MLITSYVLLNDDYEYYCYDDGYCGGDDAVVVGVDAGYYDCYADFFDDYDYCYSGYYYYYFDDDDYDEI